MLAQPVIDLINSITNDSGNITYQLPEVILSINDAQRMVCIYRPDACSSTGVFSLSFSSIQTLSSPARRLLGVTKNMGSDGATPGQYINKTTETELNLFDPSWNTETGQVVLGYAYDEARPDEFIVYPYPTSTHNIEIKTADNPTDIASGASSISVSDSYAPCLVSWACYRLFSRDGSESPNYSRADSHKQTVFDMLGVKSQADIIVSPNK